MKRMTVTCVAVVTVPKMLQFFLFRQRELLGDLSRLAYETFRKLMATAADDETVPGNGDGDPDLRRAGQSPPAPACAALAKGLDRLGEVDPGPLRRLQYPRHRHPVSSSAQ